MYPVDLVRALQMANSGSKLTTLQLLNDFKQLHGWKGFVTQGLAPELCRSTLMRALKFTLFPLVHVRLHGVPESAGTVMQKISAVLVASVPEVAAIMPLEIAKISLQLDATNRFKNNMFSAMRSVWQERGWAGMTCGYWGVQYRTAAWTAGYFASISFFESQVQAGFACIGLKNKIMATQLLSGFMAGVFGALINTPGDTVRTVLQKKVLSGAAGSAEATLLSVGRDIVAARGVGGLWSGIVFKACHLGGGGALMALLVPFFKKALADSEAKSKAATKNTKL